MPQLLSRRTLMIAGSALAAIDTARSQGALTAGQIIQLIKDKVGVPWRTETVDKIIFGAAETPIKGIATTMMATLDVIQRSAAAGKNMVITHEPTFYLHQDNPEVVAQDETYLYKVDFMRKHDVVVFRFHDHWHAHRPDGIATGMARELGWEKSADPENPHRFVFPGTPLARFAQDIESRLRIRTMRVVGKPDLQVNRVAANWGYASQTPAIPILGRPDVDVLVVGETREWELVEYAQDAVAAGKKKGLIILGHVVSEQAGMKYCAEWLKSFVTEVPVEFVAASEPFWSPRNPVS